MRLTRAEYADQANRMDKSTDFLSDVSAEVIRARAKFPDATKSMTALTEEVGELAKALLDESDSRVYEEAVQVAVMALRIATEGDRSLGR